MKIKIKKISVILTLIIVCIFITNNINDNINYNKFIPGNYNMDFKEYVVFYPQHQDDEVLWGASAIIKAIEQCGKDNVYIVLVSDGVGVNVFKKSNYKNLSKEEKKELRDNEFRDALDKLGVKKENVLILSNIEKNKKNHFKLMEDIILEFENELKSVTHIAHHYKYDDHIMHRRNGKVLKNLYKEGNIENPMYFIKPKYVKYIAENNRFIYTADTGNIVNVIKTSCNEYKIIDKSKGKFGIGYTSAHSYFDELLKNPKMKSVLSNK